MTTSQNTRGKLLVLYGINNLGKSTQAKLLVERLKKEGYQPSYLKYPIYDIEPTGPKINEVLRGGQAQAMSEEELQALYAQNRRDFEPQLKTRLAQGLMVVAEDYTGTGLAWGLTKGAKLEILENQNTDLLKEDLAIWLEGQRFLAGKEENHLHESNHELMERCRDTHKILAERYGWQPVNANQSIDQVADDIWEIVEPILK